MTTSEIPSLCEILYVDDEEKALKYFRMAFAAKYTIHVASSAKEGLEILRRMPGRIGIVVSDQRMPEMLGAEFLGIVREEFPQVIRILTTAYSDLESAIEAVNRGHIYQYVVKPWEVKDFGMVLQRAADYHHVLSERNELLALKMSTLQRILSGDRLVWWKLFLDSLPPAQRGLHERALLAYIGALPNPAKLSSGRPGMAHFDARKIVQSEYANATKTVAALGPTDTPASVDQCLKQFSTALAETHGLATDEFEASVDNGTVSIRIAPKGGSFRVGAFTLDLFGVLLERSASDFSFAFFRLLLAVAGAGGTLKLSIENGDTYSFAMGGNFPTDEGDPIDLLYEKVSRWDVADR